MRRTYHALSVGLTPQFEFIICSLFFLPSAVFLAFVLHPLICRLTRSDVTFAQLMKTGLGGNFELALSPEDPSHPDNTPATPRVAAPCHRAIRACGADAQACDTEDDESSSVPPPVTAVSLDGPQHKDAALSQGSDQAQSAQESAAPASLQTIERGNKNLAKLRATVKAVSAPGRCRVCYVIYLRLRFLTDT